MSNPSPTPTPAPAEHSLLKKSGPDDTLLAMYGKVEKRLAGQLKGHLINVIGCELALELASSDKAKFTDWLGAQETDSVYLQFQFGISEAPIWVRISRPFLTACVDCFFGGQYDGESCAAGPLNRSELRMIERLGGAVEASLSASWSTICETAIRYSGFVHDKDDVEMRLENDDILAAAARIEISGHGVEAIELVQSVDGLATIDPQQSSPLTRENDIVDPDWQRSLKDSFDQVYMPVRSVLARPTMDLSQLSRLAVGDILPVAPTDNVPLIVGDRVFAHGSIGEQNGGVAFKIKHFL